MCDSDSVRSIYDPGHFLRKTIGGAFKQPEPPKPVLPPPPPPATAQKVYSAQRPRDAKGEPQLLGTSALRIPMKTVQ